MNVSFKCGCLKDFLKILDIERNLILTHKLTWIAVYYQKKQLFVWTWIPRLNVGGYKTFDLWKYWREWLKKSSIWPNIGLAGCVLSTVERKQYLYWYTLQIKWWDEAKDVTKEGKYCIGAMIKCWHSLPGTRSPESLPAAQQQGWLSPAQSN